MPGSNDNDPTFDHDQAERIRRIFDHDPERERREALARRAKQLALQKELFEERLRRDRRRA